MQRPAARSQILMVLSSDADASSAESCDHATDLTQPLWPSSVAMQRPAARSQILMVLSSDADASSAESCDHATDADPIHYGPRV